MPWGYADLPHKSRTLRTIWLCLRMVVREHRLAGKLKYDRRRRGICELLETSSDGFKHSGSFFVRFKLRLSTQLGGPGTILVCCHGNPRTGSSTRSNEHNEPYVPIYVRLVRGGLGDLNNPMRTICVGLRTDPSLLRGVSLTVDRRSVRRR
jgi:hypothetical protein